MLVLHASSGRHRGFEPIKIRSGHHQARLASHLGIVTWVLLGGAGGLASLPMVSWPTLPRPIFGLLAMHRGSSPQGNPDQCLCFSPFMEADNAVHKAPILGSIWWQPSQLVRHAVHKVSVLRKIERAPHSIANIFFTETRAFGRGMILPNHLHSSSLVRKYCCKCLACIQIPGHARVAYRTI